MMDVARGASAVESVYVIGSDAVGIPQELNFAAHSLVFENRYTQTQTMTNTALTVYDTNEINFLFNIINQYMRMRSYTIGEQFFVATLPTIATTGGVFGDFAITPLIGMGITYWDQLYVTLGSSQQPLAPTIPYVHNTHMQRWVGYINKTDIETRKWWEMAGFVDYQTMEYCGGFAGTASSNLAAYGANPVLAAAANGVWQGQQRFGTETMNALGAQPPWGVYSTVTYPTGVQGPVRTYEGGLWLDNNMQRMRAIFYGGTSTTNINYETKIGCITDAFETPLTIPGMQFNLSLRFNEKNAIRPRYINTPFVIKDATAANTAVVTGLIDQTTYDGITPVASKFWVFSENITFRSDIHSAFLMVWVAGKGLTDHMTYYDLYQKSGIIGISNDLYTIVQQGNNAPWMSAITWEIQSYAAMTAPFVPPAKSNNIPPYVYIDVGVNVIRGQITTPSVTNFDSLFWQSAPRPTGTSSLDIAATSYRGVTDMYYWWKQMGYETQFFYETSIDDINNRSVRDLWFTPCQPAMNSFVSPAITAPSASTTSYGNLSAVYGGYYVGTGPHNQVWHQIWQPLGYKDDATDYGVLVGSLRLDITWQAAVPTTIKLNHLGAYQTALTYLGSGQVATNIRFK